MSKSLQRAEFHTGSDLPPGLKLWLVFWLTGWLQIVRELLWSSTVVKMYRLQTVHWAEMKHSGGFRRFDGMMSFPFLRTTVDLPEHWVPGILCGRRAFGWTLRCPAYWDGLWEFEFQFFPPNLEEQGCAHLGTSEHFSGSKLLQMQKPRQVLPELVAGGVIEDRL